MYSYAILLLDNIKALRNLISVDNLYTNTVLDGSVALSVRYRNHFPVVQFKNQTHIRNSHGMGQAFKIIWGAACDPNFLFITAKGGVRRRPLWGAGGVPVLFSFFYRRQRRRFPKWAP